MYKKAKHLNGVQYEIRGKVAQKSYDLKLQGINILELNIGNPGMFGFKVPDTMSMAIIKNINYAGAYVNSKGIFSAREAIVTDTQNQGIQGLDIENVFIGNGVSELIVMSMEALLNPGDEILIPSPDYPLWTASVTITGGVPQHYHCNSSNKWFPDIEHIRSLITPKTRAITVINPNNPTGAVYSKEILLEILQIAREHKLIIFSDEIYSKILYDGAIHIPIATLADDILICTFNGLSKNYRACGYRAGWMYITGSVNKAKDYINGISLIASMRLCSNTLGQYAIQTALGGIQSIENLCSDKGRLKKQKDFAVKSLQAIDGITCNDTKGALYSFPEINFEQFTFKSDEDMIFKFLDEQHVLFVQGSGFNYNRSHAFRITFLPHLEVLSEAFYRFDKFLKYHKK